MRQLVHPGGIDIDMAGRTGAGAAAIGLDAGNAVVAGAFHHGQAAGHLDDMFAPGMFDIGDAGHGMRPFNGGARSLGA